MRMFLSASPLFSPPNACIVFWLPSGEIALAGTSWFSLEVGNARITVAVQKPKTKEDWTLPKEFGLNLLPQGFPSSATSSFPHFEVDSPLPGISESLRQVVSGEIPYLANSPLVYICRQGQCCESY
ncbi:MAG: hypothetical protein JXK94_12620, partial [Deltaproteobacteria bacterium]|nr:hypothetical protein [Deltaproteobacteria bacterium]